MSELISDKAYQQKYTANLISMAKLQDSRPTEIPLEVNVKYSKEEGNLPSDPTVYLKLAGRLVYLTITRPDRAHAINIVGNSWLIHGISI